MVFFEQEGIKVSNDGVVALTEAKYRKLTAWLKFKLSTELLIDIVDEIEYWVLLCKVYKKLVSAQIDFNTEVVVFSHDW